MPIGSEAFSIVVSGLIGQISGVNNPNALAPLALRRWCGGLTLASPETVPTFYAISSWFTGLAALTAVALLVQGPRKALLQLFGLPGLFALWGQAFNRVKNANRLFIVFVAASVLTWTGSQAVSFGHAQAREAIQNRAKDDLSLLNKSRSLGELALEQGAFAAVIPLRDLGGLGGCFPLLAVATIALFRVSTDHLGSHHQRFDVAFLPRISPWAFLAWVSGSLYLIYRMISDGSGEPDLPWSGCLMIESILIPFLMLVCDGILLSWFLVELRDAGIEPHDADRWNTRPTAELLPAAMLACAATLPARYLATGVLILVSSYLPTSVGSTALGAWIRWILGRGLTDIQAAALIFCPLAGAVAWTRGSLRDAVVGYFRMIREEGGRAVGFLASAGLACGLAAAVIYPVLLSFPSSFWLLNAADAYAHLATSGIGLLTLAGLVTLAERSLPEAVLAPKEIVVEDVLVVELGV